MIAGTTAFPGIKVLPDDQSRQLMKGGELKFVLDNKSNLMHSISPESYPY